MASLDQIFQALLNADAAGDTEAATALAQEYRKLSEAPVATAEKPFFDLSETLSATGKAFTSLGTTLPASMRQAFGGLENPWQRSEPYLKSRESMQALQEELDASEAAAQESGDISSVSSAIRGATPSLGFSASTLAPSLAAGAAAGLATKSPAAARSAAAGTSLLMAYRMAGAQFLDDARDRIDNFFQEKLQRPLTPEEQQEAYEELLPLARKFGAAEAGPEALGNLALGGAGKYIRKALGGKNGIMDLASNALSKVTGAKAVAAGVGAAAGEVGTEAITAVEQDRINQELEQSVLRGESPESVVLPDRTVADYTKGVTDVAPETLAMTGLMGLAGLGPTAINRGYRALRPQAEQAQPEAELPPSEVMQNPGLAAAVQTADNLVTTAVDVSPDVSKAAEAALEVIQSVAETPSPAMEMPEKSSQILTGSNVQTSTEMPVSDKSTAISPSEAPIADRPSPNLPPRAEMAVEPRPARKGRDTSERDAWDEKYGVTHNEDGTPYQPTIYDETVAKALNSSKQNTFDQNIDSFGVDSGIEIGTAIEQLLNDGWVWDETVNKMVNPANPTESPIQGLTRIRSKKESATAPTPAAKTLGVTPPPSPTTAPKQSAAEKALGLPAGTLTPPATPAREDQIQEAVEPKPSDESMFSDERMAEIIAQEEADRQAMYELNGFDKTVPANKLEKVVGELNDLIPDQDDNSVPIKDLVKRMVDNGATLQTKGKRTVLRSPDGFEISKSTMGETGLKYTKFLLEQKAPVSPLAEGIERNRATIARAAEINRGAKKAVPSTNEFVQKMTGQQPSPQGAVPTPATEGKVMPGGSATERDVTKPEQMTPEEALRVLEERIGPNDPKHPDYSRPDWLEIESRVEEGENLDEVLIDSAKGYLKIEQEREAEEAAAIEATRSSPDKEYVRAQAKMSPDQFDREVTLPELKRRNSGKKIAKDAEILKRLKAMRGDGDYFHAKSISEAIDARLPVNVEAVDAYGITLPEGYVKQGDLYIFQPEVITSNDNQTALNRGRLGIEPPSLSPKEEIQPKGNQEDAQGSAQKNASIQETANTEQPSVKAPPEGKKSLYQIRAAKGRPATDADGVPTGWKLNEFRDAIELVSEDASKYVVFSIENPSSYGDKMRALIMAENWAIDNPVRAQIEAAPMQANYGAGRVEDVTLKTVKFVHTTKTKPGKGQKTGYYPGTYAYESESGLLPSMEGKKFVGELPESNIYTLKDADQLKKDAADAGFGMHSGNGNAEVKYLRSLGFKAMRRPSMGGTEIIVFDTKDANFQPQTTTAATETETAAPSAKESGGSLSASPGREGGRSVALEPESPVTAIESTEKTDVAPTTNELARRLDKLIAGNATTAELDAFVAKLSDEQLNGLIASEMYDVDPAKLTIKPGDSRMAIKNKRRTFVDSVGSGIRVPQQTADKIFKEEEKGLERQRMREELALKTLNSLIEKTRTNVVQGAVKPADAQQAISILNKSGDIPNVLFTWIGTSKDFLADPANKARYPETWKAVSANPNIEGMFENGQPIVFLDNVGVSDLDRKLAKLQGTTPEVAAVRRVIIHENIHKGMFFLNMKDKMKLFQFLHRLYSPEELDQLAKSYDEYADWRTNQVSYFSIIEEAMNRDFDSMVEIPRDGIWAEFMQFLREIWQKITGKTSEPKLKDYKDVFRLIRNSLKNSEKVNADRLKNGGAVRMSMGEFISNVTPEQDAAYMAAVEAGDMETAQRMVDEAAKAAGFNVGPVWHGSPDEEFTIFQKPERDADEDGFWFSKDREWASKFGPTRLFYIKNAKTWGGDDFVVKEPNSIKSADPVTRDADGNVIPLSRRFQAASPDIRFSYAGIESLVPLDEAIQKIESFAEDNEDTGSWPDDVTQRFEESEYYQAIENNDAVKAWELASDNIRDAELLPLVEIAKKANQYGQAWDEASEKLRKAGKYSIENVELELEKTLPADVIEASNADLSKLEEWLSSDEVLIDAKRPFIEEAGNRIDATIKRIEDTGRYTWDGSKFEPIYDTDVSVRFSKVEYDSPNEAVFNSGAEVARNTNYDERDKAVRSAIRAAYDLAPKPNGPSVPLDQLFDLAKQSMPDLTEAEFSQILQDLYEDSGALLQAGNAVASDSTPSASELKDQLRKAIDADDEAMAKSLVPKDVTVIRLLETQDLDEDGNPTEYFILSNGSPESVAERLSGSDASYRLYESSEEITDRDIRSWLFDGLFEGIVPKKDFGGITIHRQTVESKGGDFILPRTTPKQFNVTTPDGERAGSAIIVSSLPTGAMASTVDPESAASKEFAANVKAINNGTLKAAFDGVQFVNVEPVDHIVKPNKSYEKIAIDYVDGLMGEGQSIEQIATAIMTPMFFDSIGASNDVNARQALTAEVRRRVADLNGLSNTRLAGKKLQKLEDLLSSFWQGLGSESGRNQGQRAYIIGSPRYAWMFLKDTVKKAMKERRDNILIAQFGENNATSFTQNSYENADKAATISADGVAKDPIDTDEWDLIKEGEQVFDGARKTMWERVKFLVARIALYARAEAAEIKSASKASFTDAQRDELKAILTMPKEEREKAKAKDLAELDALMAKLVGEESPTDAPAEKTKRKKRKIIIDTVKKRADKGEPIESTEATETSEDEVTKAEATAQAILKDLSERYSDPLIFRDKKPNINEMRELYKERVKQGNGTSQMTEEAFVNKAIKLGADAKTAGILWSAAELEIDAREAMRQDKIRQRNAVAGERADAQAHRIIFAKERLKRQSGFADIDTNQNKDTIIKAFREQVDSPVSLNDFIQRVIPLKVSRQVAERLFKAAEREKTDLAAMAVFDRTQGPKALKRMINEINNMRRGEEIPLRTPIPWRQLLSQKASTVEEYRQRIFDAISANEELKAATPEQKARLADLFSEAWESNRKRILDSMLERMIREQEAKKNLSEKGAKALQEQRMRIVEDINLGIFDNDEIAKIMAEKFGIKSEFTDAEREKIESLVEVLQDESLNRVKRNKAAYELLETLSAQTDIPIAKLLANFWVSSVLSGMNTVFSIGMAVFSGMGELTTALSRIFIASFSNPKQLPSELAAAFKTLARVLSAVPRQANRAWQYLVTGDQAFLDPTMNDALKNMDWDSIGKNNQLAEQMAKSDKILEKSMGLFMRTVSRLLTALDLFNSGLTKEGSLSIVFRQLDLGPEAIAMLEKRSDLKPYKDEVINKYFGGIAPKTAREKALVDSYAIAEMMKALDEVGNVSENADQMAMQGAMTLDPSGVGGYGYRAVKSLMKSAETGADKLLERNLRKWDEAKTASDKTEAFVKLGLSYLFQFAAYNAANLVGVRFARFAGNKFNQSLSFLPGLGALRLFEAEFDSDRVRGKEAFTDMIKRNQLTGLLAAVFGYYVLKWISDEPDDEERGWFINGGWSNLTPEKKQQKLAAGEKEYTIGMGGKVFNYANWPGSGIIAAIGSLSDLIRFSPEQWNDKTVPNKLLSATTSGVFSALEVPALSQFQELFGSSLSSKDPNEQKLTKFARVLGNYAGGFMPRILKDLDYLADPNFRKYETLWEKTASHIPVYRRYAGQEYYDILGQQIQRNIYPGSREFMTKPTDPAYKILGALNSRGIWLTPANAEHRMVGKGARRRKLTQEEADNYGLETGKGYKQMLLRYGQRALQMPTERARDFLLEKANDVRDKALKKVYRGYTPAN